ncbi:cytokine receptor family member b2 [Salminus brasiliensis]|uniref:cytokine receptor family member b2 n=1 Tax=Salminus brasiliensis TaxID=930266 RepID=UPI003B832BA1
MGGVHLPLLLIAMLPTLPSSVLCMHLPAPVNLLIDSQHFVHLLSWEAGPGSPKDVYYSVKVCILGEVGRSCEMAPCSPVKRSPLQCNLTEVFTDPHKTYYTRVYARSGTLTSQPTELKPFEPFKNTVPDPPLLTVVPCSESLCVQLQAPSKRLLSIYNCTVYPCFKYKLNISVNGKFKFSKEVQSLQTVVLQHLMPGQQYCVNIGIKDHSSAYSPAVCASTTKGETNSGALIFVALCITALPFFVFFGVLSRIFCLKTRLPFVLDSFRSPYKVQLICYPTIESLHNVSLGTDTIKGIKEDEEHGDDEYQEYENVTYERLGDKTGSCCGTSETGSSNPLSPDDHSEADYDRTHGHVRDIPISSIPVAKAHYATAPKEQILKQLHRTEYGLQQKSVKSQIERQRFATGILSEDLTNKNFLRHGHKDKEEQNAEAECSINVNLFSLILRGCVEEEQWKKEKAGNMEIPELVVPTSLQKGQENLTDIQPTHSSDFGRHVTNFRVMVDEETEEEEEEEEEDNDSGYIKRNRTEACTYIHRTPSMWSAMMTTPSKQHWILKMWILLFILKHQVYCLLPAPQNVTIVSFNLEHKLTWTPGPGTPAFAQFRVQKYTMKKHLWKPVLNCSDLRTGERCDLTNSLKDLYCHYLVRVQAFSSDQESNWTSSKLFYPLWQTTLGPPEVALTGCGNCLLLKLSRPASRGLHTRQLEYLFRDYNVNVSRTRDKAHFVIMAYSGENRIDYLEKGVEYCVMILPVTKLNNPVVPSGPHCAYTSPPPVNTVAVFLTALCILFLLVVLFCAALIHSGQLGMLHKALRTLVKVINK